MKRFIESPAGTPQEPLPAEVPTDADHINTPRDRRAEALAAQQGRPKPRPTKHPDALQSDALLWRARAFQNRAEARAYAAERDLARQEAKEHHRQVMGMKTAHRQRLAEVEELRAEVADLRARLEDNR